MKYRTAEASESDFATLPTISRMLELMESAASRLMNPRLLDGETSVAVAMDVTYAANSLRHPNGSSTMRAVASYNGIAGRLHRFKVHAFDESGLIGTADHTRAVVIEHRLTSIAGHRVSEPGTLHMV